MLYFSRGSSPRVRARRLFRACPRSRHSAVPMSCRLIACWASAILGKPNNWRLMHFLRRIKARLGFFRLAATRYHIWYYRKGIWDTTTWIGVKTLKSPSDMWNYQEILTLLQPSLVIEFGTRFGG